jgi:hypothetical protein
MTDEIGQSKGDSGASCDRQTVQVREHSERQRRGSAQVRT